MMCPKSSVSRSHFCPALRETPIYTKITMQQEISRAAINQRAEEILNTYGNSILRYAYTYLHNMSDAEEVLQDTLVQFLKTAPVFESREHEKAWLLRVAGNLSKNRLAYNSLRRTDELNDELVAENRENLSFVWDAVKLLPENYREAIHLFYYEGYSTKQIAKLLGKKEATVRSDLRRGRERLKAVLKEAYDFEEAV
jgi:RNA polymerase sigma factor (sigma-70 family)